MNTAIVGCRGAGGSDGCSGWDSCCTRRGVGCRVCGAGWRRHHRRAAQGYLGIEMRDVSEEQIGELKLKEARGAEIINLDHDGPACKAGMRMHDVILQMNGQSVEGEEQLRRMLRETPAGGR